MAKTSVVTKAKKGSKKAEAPRTYCFKCQEMTDTNGAEVVKLFKIGRLMRKGTCKVCGTSVNVMVAASTPYDREQTKKEYEASQAKKTAKKEKFLDIRAGNKVKKAAAATKASQKKLVEVPRPVLKQRDGETTKAFKARTERVWETRKAAAVA